MTYRLLLAAALSVSPPPPLPPRPPRQPLTLERVFAAPSLSGPVPRMVSCRPTPPRHPASHRPTMSSATPCASSPLRHMRMLVDSKKVAAARAHAARMQRERARTASLKGIVTYDWAPDGKSLLVPSTATSISPPRRPGPPADHHQPPTRRLAKPCAFVPFLATSSRPRPRHAAPPRSPTAARHVQLGPR